MICIDDKIDAPHCNVTKASGIIFVNVVFRVALENADLAYAFHETQIVIALLLTARF